MLTQSEATPPSPPLSAESGTPPSSPQQNVLRTHCGWSFKVLEPFHADPQMRKFVACTVCKRPYLAIYASAADFKCTAIHCTGTQFKPVAIPPPGPLDRDRRIPLRVKAGPHNAIDDPPLGITTGTLVFEQSGAVPMQMRNNSNQPVRLPAVATAPWISWQWVDLPLSPYATLELAPGELQSATVTVGAFRPIEDDDVLQFPRDRSVMIVSNQLRELFHCIWFLLLVLGMVHWIASMIHPLLFLLTSTIWLASLLLFSPKLAQGIILYPVGIIDIGTRRMLLRGLQREAVFTRQGLLAWSLLTLLVTVVAAIISLACLAVYLGIQAVASPLEVLLHFVLVITTVNWYTARRGYNPVLDIGRKLGRFIAWLASKKSKT